MGCLSSNQDGYRGSDIDLFLYGITTEEQANQKVNKSTFFLISQVREIYQLVVSNTKGKGDVIRTSRALTILCAYPFRHLQIILRLYRSPAEVLLGFDIDSCCVGYDGKSFFFAFLNPRNQCLVSRTISKSFNEKIQFSEYQVQKFSFVSNFLQSSVGHL